MAKIRIDDALIRHLAGLLEETGLTEIELGSGRERIRVSRESPSAPPAPSGRMGEQNDSPSAISSDLVVESTSSVEEVEPDHPGAVTAPMVGTVYLAPEPGENPFISVGDEVQAGDTMFIIEAMKTMNPVSAPRDGRVERVLVGNATPVEYGEVLALVD